MQSQVQRGLDEPEAEPKAAEPNEARPSQSEPSQSEPSHAAIAMAGEVVTAEAAENGNGLGATVESPGAAALVEETSEAKAPADAADAEPDASDKLFERGEQVTRDLGASLARKLKRGPPGRAELASGPASEPEGDGDAGKPPP